MTDRSDFQMHRYQHGTRAKPIPNPDRIYRVGDELKASTKTRPGLNPYSLAASSLTTPMPIFRNVRSQFAELLNQ
jgi:hypothetical protein